MTPMGHWPTAQARGEITRKDGARHIWRVVLLQITPSFDEMSSIGLEFARAILPTRSLLLFGCVDGRGNLHHMTNASGCHQGKLDRRHGTRVIAEHISLLKPQCVDQLQGRCGKLLDADGLRWGFGFAKTRCVDGEHRTACRKTR